MITIGVDVFEGPKFFLCELANSPNHVIEVTEEELLRIRTCAKEQGFVEDLLADRCRKVGGKY